MDPLQPGTCAGCGASIFWGVTAKSGSRVPLDSPPERRFVRNAEGLMLVVLVYVSHFITCPKSAQFRHKKARQALEEQEPT